MKRFALCVMVVFAVCFLSSPARAATVYVIPDTNTGTEDGTSWANAYDTLAEGLTGLATVNSGSQGGHTLLISNGTYAADLKPIDSTHAGLVASPNTIEAFGKVTISGEIEISGGANTPPWASNIVVSGFHVINGTPGIKVSRAENVIIGNCNVYDTGNDGVGIHTEHYLWNEIQITNCTVWSCGGQGILLSGTTGDATIYVKNCIVAGNGWYGVQNSSGSGPATYMSNCCIYANNRCNIYDGPGGDNLYTDESEINTPSWVGDCYSRNPGFADIGNDWNFAAFFDNSICLTGGEGGQRMGAHQTVTEYSSTEETYYVKTDGDDTASGLDWNNAWLTLTNAAATAGAGDTVVVGAGTYNEEVTILRGSSHERPAVWLADGDVLVQSAGSTPFALDGVSEVTLDGFKVDGGTGSGDDGVSVSDGFWNVITNVEAYGSTYGITSDNAFNTRIENCDIHDNDTYGVNLAGGYDLGGALVRNCRIYNNTDMGIYVGQSDCRIERCRIFSNSGPGIRPFGTTGSASVGDDLIVYNCSIYSNSVGGVYAYAHTVINMYNCTVYGNDVGLTNSPSAYGTDMIHANNCIIVGNTLFGAAEDPLEDIHADTSLFWNNGPGAGTNHFLDTTTTSSNLYGTVSDMENLIAPAGSVANVIVADPLFADAANGNYRLKSGSPAIEAGDNSFIAGFENLDVDGNTRLKQANVDLGAYEWQPPAGTLFLVR